MPSGLAASSFPSLQSQEAHCRGIPITLARDAPLSLSLASFPLLPVSSSAPLFPSEVDNKDILGVLLDVRPALDLFSLCFLYLSVALLSNSASTIFTLQKTKPGWIFHAGQGSSERTNHPATYRLHYLGQDFQISGIGNLRPCRVDMLFGTTAKDGASWKELVPVLICLNLSIL